MRTEAAVFACQATVIAAGCAKTLGTAAYRVQVSDNDRRRRGGRGDQERLRDRARRLRRLGRGRRWDFHAGYLTDTLILASNVETDQHSGRHLLVQRATMRLSGEMVYPAGQPPSWIAGPHQGTWLTIDDHGLQRWTLAG